MQKPQYIEVKIVPPVRSFYLAMLLEEIGTIGLRPSVKTLKKVCLHDL